MEVRACLIISTAITCLIGWQVYLTNYAPVYEFHDVRFVRELTNYSWSMEKSDGPFKVDFCKDYPIYQLNPKPGEVLEKIRYQDRGCWSIARKDLGIWWKKDANGQIIGDN